MTADFIEVLKNKGMFVDGTQSNGAKEITSPEEFVERFHDQLVAISEPKQFIETIELLNMMDIGGALVYTTGGENERGLFVLHTFNEVKYDEEEHTVSFFFNDGADDDCNASEFVIPVGKMEYVHGYISNEDDGEGDFYCLNIDMWDSNINIVWNC